MSIFTEKETASMGKAARDVLADEEALPLLQAAPVSPLQKAFDQCPVAFFSFLSDHEAAQLACALCVPQFLSSKRYDIKRELALAAVLTGRYRGVVRKVIAEDEVDWGKIPSTITSMRLYSVDVKTWRAGNLPRSLTDLTLEMCSPGPLYTDALPDEKEQWPSQLTSLRLRYIEVGRPFPFLFPSTLRHLYLYQAHSFDFLADLPSLESLEVDNEYGDGPVISQLPSTLTSLRMRLPPGSSPEDLLALPHSLTHLQIYQHPDDAKSMAAFEQVALKFPPSLQHLSLDLPCQSIELPSSLQSLRFGCNNEVPPLPHLPPSLHELSFEQQASYEHALRSTSLRKLVLPEYFDQQVCAADFPALTSLTVMFSNQLHDDLPPGLTELTVTNESIQKLALRSLPRSLKKLDVVCELKESLDHLPEGLLDLTISCDLFNQPVDHLPRSLTRLVLGATWVHAFNQRVDALPESLTELVLPLHYNQPLDSLPSSLQTLRFDTFAVFNHPIDRLPDSLTVLRLGKRFNQPIASLPRNLTSLSFGEQFNRPLPLVAPSDGQAAASRYPTALRSLQLGRDFNQPLSLPASLTRLIFPRRGEFSQALPACSMPSGLMELTLPRSYRGLDQQAVRERCPFVLITQPLPLLKNSYK